MNCLLQTCENSYIGETARRIQERIKDHNGRDHKSHMLKHSIEKHHDNVTQENFKIIAKNFKKKQMQTKNIRITLDKGLTSDPQRPREILSTETV